MTGRFTNQARVEFFHRLWTTSSHDPVPVMIPSRAKTRIPLPSPAWFYILECLSLPPVAQAKEKCVFLPPYWQEAEVSVELIFEEGARKMIALHPPNHLRLPQLIDDLMDGTQPFPQPEDIYRWDLQTS